MTLVGESSSHCFHCSDKVNHMSSMYLNLIQKFFSSKLVAIPEGFLKKMWQREKRDESRVEMIGKAVEQGGRL